ncbi:MAG: hypothetical protein D4S01_05065 [Dehalococcoidia bacterium]|nr:MAG: hypothetical protein D4S01_05065 [Dehalococcoidia bacterium]
MSDRGWARISVHGDLSEANVDDFVDAIDPWPKPTGTNLEWLKEHIIKHIFQASLNYFDYEEDEVRYAEFESLEIFCQKHGLAYLRSSEDQESFWEPGMESPETFATMDGDRVVTESQIRNTLKYVEQAGTIEKAALLINESSTLKSAAKQRLKYPDMAPMEAFCKILDEVIFPRHQNMAEFRIV